MKLRNKLIVLFSVLILIVTSLITAFSTLRQKQSFIENELNFQRQTLELLSNTLSLQYYNYIYNQIIDIINEKKRLLDNGTLFKYDIKNIYIDSSKQKLQNFYQILKQKQSLYNQINIDLIVLHKDSIFLEPANRALLKAKTVNKQSIKNILLATNTQNSTYYGLFANNKQFIAMCFKNDGKSDFVYAFISDVSALTKQYSGSNKFISDTLQEQLQNLKNNWSGRFLIIDAKDDSILLDSQNNTQAFESLNLNQAIGYSTQISLVENEQNYVFAVYFKPLNYYAVTLRDKAQTIAQITENISIMLTIGLITLGIAIISAIGFTSKLTQKLNKILTHVKSISKSNLQDKYVLSSIAYNFKSSGHDEIALLGNTFMNIALSLSDKIDELIAINVKQTKLDNELQTANLIQKAMLREPLDLPKNKYIQVWSYCKLAKAVGGNFYDAFFIDDKHIGFCIGGVSDKGVAAALFMSTTLTLVRLSLELKQEPYQAMYTINNKLVKYNPNMMFVTLFIGILNIKTGQLDYVNASHCKPILIKNNKEVNILDSQGGIAIGIMEHVPYLQSKCFLKENESLLLYTDGVKEVCNNKQELYGQERILNYARHIRLHDCKIIVGDLVEDIDRFRFNAVQDDDITIMCITRKNTY